jgi:hypothetical protein
VGGAVCGDQDCAPAVLLPGPQAGAPATGAGGAAPADGEEPGGGPAAPLGAGTGADGAGGGAVAAGAGCVGADAAAPDDAGLVHTPSALHCWPGPQGGSQRETQLPAWHV